MVSESECIYTLTHLKNLAVLLSLALSSPGNHPCFSCKTAGREVMRCSVSGCGCFYHEDCVRKLLGTTSSPGGGFCCPQHICSTCCLERDLQRASKGFSALFDVFNLDRDAARPINYSEIKKNNASLCSPLFWFAHRPSDALYPMSSGLSHRGQLRGGGQRHPHSSYHDLQQSWQHQEERPPHLPRQCELVLPVCQR